MFEMLGICLTLAALITLNAFASLLTAALWRALRPYSQTWPAYKRAQILFALRVFPGLAAIVCVAALVLPAYIAHEPRHSAEEVSLKLALLAAISVAGLLMAAWRGLAAWRATRKLIRNWLQNSEPVELPQAKIPAYRLRHSFPVIAVVGTFQPRLFIADHLFGLLSREELTAAIAHECGHLAASDNLKRALMRACRDALTIVPCGRQLDREWVAASEVAADEYAAQNGGETALDLAAALIKIARLVPIGSRPAMPASALLIGEDPATITQRVNRLTQLSSADDQTVESANGVISASLWFSFGALLAVAILLAIHPNSLVAIHQLIEVAVSSLQ